MTEPLILHQRIKLPYRYTAGPVHTAVLRALVDQKLLGGSCASCGYVAAPARPFCPHCSAKVEDLVEVAQEGVVLSWTDPAGDPAPRFALVRLDGTDGAMLHRLVSSEPPTRDQRVRIQWSADRSPEITAIDGFVPL